MISLRILFMLSGASAAVRPLGSARRPTVSSRQPIPVAQEGELGFEGKRKAESWTATSSICMLQDHCQHVHGSMLPPSCNLAPPLPQSRTTWDILGLDFSVALHTSRTQEVFDLQASLICPKSDTGCPQEAATERGAARCARDRLLGIASLPASTPHEPEAEGPEQTHHPASIGYGHTKIGMKTPMFVAIKLALKSRLSETFKHSKAKIQGHLSWWDRAFNSVAHLPGRIKKAVIGLGRENALLIFVFAFSAFTLSTIPLA